MGFCKEVDKFFESFDEWKPFLPKIFLEGVIVFMVIRALSIFRTANHVGYVRSRYCPLLKSFKQVWMYDLLVKHNFDGQDYSSIYLVNSVRQRKKKLKIYILIECVAEWILVSEKHSECTTEENIGEPLIDRKSVHSLPSANVNSSFSFFSSFRFDFTLLYSIVLSNLSCGILPQLQSYHQHWGWYDLHLRINGFSWEVVPESETLGALIVSICFIYSKNKVSSAITFKDVINCSNDITQ